MGHSWVQHYGGSVLLTVGHSNQLLGCTPKEMKSNTLQLAEAVLMEPFKSRIALVSENMANHTQADVISQLLPQSEQVPPRLSESQLDAFHTTGSCSIKHREAFWSPVSCRVLPWPPLPTTWSPKARWLKRAQLNQHMLRLVMTPVPLLLLVYQCSLVLPSIFCCP